MELSDEVDVEALLDGLPLLPFFFMVASVLSASVRRRKRLTFFTKLRSFLPSFLPHRMAKLTFYGPSIPLAPPPIGRTRQAKERAGETWGWTVSRRQRRLRRPARSMGR